MSRKQLIFNITACFVAAAAVALTVVFTREPAGGVPDALTNNLAADSESPADSELPVEPNIRSYWAFFLINAENLLPADYEPELAPIAFSDHRDFYLDKRAAPFAIEMLSAAEADGINLVVSGAYRTRQHQLENFNNYVERMIREHGMSEEEAIVLTSTQIALPGASEHNAGLAVDILSYDWFEYNTDVTEEFERTPEFRWLAANSWKFGFILRYPKGKEDITGIIYEPWHFRYVGVDIAEQIFNSGLTLEEYIYLYPPITVNS
jgi:D-alanyl-D-alanine carboxypeptidase